MRRIAAVFAAKRSDKSDAASSSAASATTDQTQPTIKQSSKRFFRSISRKSKPVDPIVNRLNSSDLHPPSSSSSSSGAPTTPDDDRGSLLRAPATKAWLTLPHPVDSRLGSFHHLDPALREHSRSPAALRPTASPSTLDTDDESEESSLAPDLSRPPERLPPPLSAQAYLLALTSNYLRLPYAPPPLLHVPANRPAFPRSSNARRILPFADSLESTMHRKKLQRRLERGDLSPSDARSIAAFAGRRNVAKERPSLYLNDTAVREGRVLSYSPALRSWADRPCFEDRLSVLLSDNVPASPSGEPLWTRVAPATGFGVAALEYSVTLELLAGLYEDELPREPERQSPVPDASALGYLRLDTKLSIDLGPILSHTPTTLSPSSSLSPPSPATMTSPPPSSAVPSLKPVQSPPLLSSQSRGQSYKASPSPLRQEAVSSLPPTPSTAVVSPATSTASTAVASPPNPPSIVASPPPSASSVSAPLKPALKQGVRFAEEEKEDRIPLGYVMRIKQKREEKARFLEAERQRRKHDDERRKHEEEKRKWEEERAAWEREKRAMEEERKKRLLADEVAAARSRRESQRFGLGAQPHDGLATGQWDRNERARPAREESSSPYTRTVYDPAHQGLPRHNSDSSLALPKTSRQGSHSGSGSGSPADSRPNSVYGAGSVNSSRPTSLVPTPSSSQQDVRPRERRMSGSGGSRRGSMVSESGGSWRKSQVMPVPPMPSSWMGMNMNVPPMPMSAIPMGMPMQPMPMQVMPMPMYGMGMDMPLLPPSPPFMMQQYGPRSPGQNSSHSHSHSSQRSHSSSPTMGRQHLPSSNSNNGSSERVNRLSQARGSSASARAPSVPRSETASMSTPHRSRHQRTASGEVPHRPPNPRTHTEDRRSSKVPVSQSQRPTPTHSSSLPPQPPTAYTQARSSWALPQAGFENVSRPNPGRRQTVIS